MSIEIIAKEPKIRWKPTHDDDYQRIYDLLAFINDERTKRYWPIDGRGVYYHITNHPNFQHSTHWNARSGDFKGQVMAAMYNNVNDIVNYLRQTGEIPWNAITDDQRNISQKLGDSSPVAFLEDNLRWLFNGWSTCLAKNQPRYIEVWVEKNGLFRACELAADRYCRRVVSCRGFQSQYFLHEYAKRAAKERDQDKELVILYFGDYNVAGMNISQAICDALVYTHHVHDLRFIRCGLNRDHIENIDASSEFPKGSDKVQQKFIEQYGDKCYDLNALELDGVEQFVDDSLQEWTDMELLELDRETGKQIGAKFQLLRSATIKFARNMAKNMGLTH